MQLLDLRTQGFGYYIHDFVVSEQDRSAGLDRLIHQGLRVEGGDQTPGGVFYSYRLEERFAITGHRHDGRDFHERGYRVEELVAFAEAHGEAHYGVGDFAALHLLLGHPPGVQVRYVWVRRGTDGTGMHEFAHPRSVSRRQDILRALVVDLLVAGPAPLSDDSGQMDDSFNPVACHLEGSR